VTWVLIAICAVAAIYQLLALAASLWHALSRAPRPSAYPPVSILKPIRGVTPEILAAIQTHLKQDYPEFELLLGVREDERAAFDIADPRVRVILCQTVTPNRKAGSLIDLAAAARHGLVIVNDADISVPQGYVRDIVAALQPAHIGLVTSVYRAQGLTWPGRFEGLGVATDFAPSALVAPFVGVSEFGLGSTLAFRRTDLERIGGFQAISDFLADDYQLGCKLHALGRRNVIAKPVVSTTLAPQDWSAVWRHQLRWSRTVRLSRAAGYAGLPVTFATFWASLAMICGLPFVAIGVLAVRLISAVTVGYFVLRSTDALRLCFLIPLRDLYSVAVWFAALFGDTVEWGGETLYLDRRGRIVTKQKSHVRNIDTL